eukprot:2722383-Pyramimonas_sp.AAC.1
MGRVHGTWVLAVLGPLGPLRLDLALAPANSRCSARTLACVRVRVWCSRAAESRFIIIGANAQTLSLQEGSRLGLLKRDVLTPSLRNPGLPRSGARPGNWVALSSACVEGRLG